MPINSATLATALKASFSNSSDPVLKALTDAHYTQMAVDITNQIKTGSAVVPSVPITVLIT